ncbi:MAG: sugar transferase [Dissulfurispiraceae bacterium]|jgi:lipopolysaccharide/colanic/teichoic acid biosynthesis glycosyltransferase|nr:sugar transferase [Dissulfurispiraceae bacterium]
MIKRFFDILLILFAMPLWLPISILVYTIMRFYIGRPVIFRQIRPGLRGIPFAIYKFRTMDNVLNDNEAPQSDSERMTSFGAFLRSTSLDELPELFNVLKGDMSLVGPRPLLMEYLPLYSPEQKRRHEVRPGITGWAQVNGRNALSWDEKFKLDVWYVDNQSFFLDLWIILITIKKVFFREGISQKGQVTMEKFKGPIQ